MEWIEGNKLIRKFLNPEYDILEDWVLMNDNIGTRWHISVEKFHSSWDALMPVVEKIGKISPYIIHENGIRISDAGITYKRHPTIEAVWSGVVLYIQLYNKTKTNG
jgi:hypothetical protein